MLNGFDRAVGPVQRGERPNVAPYRCQAAAFDETGKDCLFSLLDAGAGRMYVECVPHKYGVIAVDWTAPHFAGGRSLPEQLAEIREQFAALKALVGGDVDETIPSITQQRFGDVFDAITRNLGALASAIGGRRATFIQGNAETANGG